MSRPTAPARAGAVGRAATGAAALCAAAGAAAYLTAFRPRSQIFGPFPFRGATTEKVVALTFDDGPNEPYTSRLLDTLDERGVKATFFQVGRCAERYPAVTRRVVGSGHVLGNHSYSHSFLSYLSRPSQRGEIDRGQRVLTDIAGVSPALYRPPWLCHPPWVLGSVRAAGLSVVSGTFADPREVLQPAAATMARHAAGIARPGTVLILHDGRESRGGPREQSVAAVAPLIDALAARGYRFVTVDELLGVAPYLQEAGPR